VSTQPSSPRLCRVRGRWPPVGSHRSTHRQGPPVSWALGSPSSRRQVSRWGSGRGMCLPPSPPSRPRSGGSLRVPSRCTSGCPRVASCFHGVMSGAVTETPWAPCSPSEISKQVPRALLLYCWYNCRAFSCSDASLECHTSSIFQNTLIRWVKKD